MVTPLKDPLSTGCLSNVLINGQSSSIRHPIITPLEAPLDELNMSFSEHFHPSSIVVPLDESPPASRTLPGEPRPNSKPNSRGNFNPPLKVNDRRMIMKRFMADPNRVNLRTPSPRIFQQLRIKSPSPMELLEEEDEGPPILSPVDPLGFEYDSEEIKRTRRSPEIELEAPPISPIQGPVEEGEEDFAPGMYKGYVNVWSDGDVDDEQAARPPIPDAHRESDRLRRVRLRGERKEANLDEVLKPRELLKRKKEELNKYTRDFIAKCREKIQGLKDANIRDGPKHAGGRPLKKARGCKAHENNAQREYERNERRNSEERIRKALNELATTVEEAHCIDASHVVWVGELWKSETAGEEIMNRAKNIYTMEKDRLKQIKKATFRKASHKAKLWGSSHKYFKGINM